MYPQYQSNKMATHIANPRKKFNFSITIYAGAYGQVQNFLVQKVTLPSIEVEQTIHGEANNEIKTPGRVKYGNLRIEKMLWTDQEDSLFYNWIDNCQSAILGGGGLPSSLWKTIVVKELSVDGITPVNVWQYDECWPCKIDGQDLDRVSSDNSMEIIEFSVNYVAKGGSNM